MYASGLLVSGLVVTALGIVPSAGHAMLNGPSPADLAGIVAGVAGLVLIAAAFHVLFAGTRRRTKLLAIPLALVLAQFYVLPVLVLGTAATNATRGGVADAATLGIAGARDVSFTASDGVRLSGWYVPGRKRAAVILLHGSHSSRAATTPYLRFLHGAGFTALAYDARGHGRSAGHENALGWYGDRDLTGAVAYLRRHGAGPIGALGLSMGAEEALRAAAAGTRVRAVVADGAGASTLGDIRLENGGDQLSSAVTWVGMRAIELFSGDREPVPLRDAVRDIRVPVLLVASNRPHERQLDSAYAARIGAGARLWHVADAGHTQAFARHPDHYRERVLAFLDDALH